MTGEDLPVPTPTSGRPTLRRAGALDAGNACITTPHVALMAESGLKLKLVPEARCLPVTLLEKLLFIPREVTNTNRYTFYTLSPKSSFCGTQS